MAQAKVKFEHSDDGVAVITMNDPSTLNAINIPVVEELNAALSKASGIARAVVLTGEGRGFSSGANLDPNDSALGFGDVGGILESHLNPLIRRLRDLEIPLVTAVNGAAAGVGCSLALMGDLIVAAESAYFLQAFRRVGLVPDGGATYLLPRMIGRARAMEMMMLGDKLPAAKALEWGLINRCVPDAELMTTARALALDLARGPKSLSMIRRLVWDGLDAHWAEQLKAERDRQRDAGRTQDCAEGVAAFLEKRKAQFKGA